MKVKSIRTSFKYTIQHFCSCGQLPYWDFFSRGAATVPRNKKTFGVEDAMARAEQYRRDKNKADNKDAEVSPASGEVYEVLFDIFLKNMKIEDDGTVDLQGKINIVNLHILESVQALKYLLLDADVPRFTDDFFIELRILSKVSGKKPIEYMYKEYNELDGYIIDRHISQVLVKKDLLHLL